MVFANPTHGGGRPVLGTQTITLDLRRPVAEFSSDRAFGVAFDGGDEGESRPLLAPVNRAALVGVGVAQGTYRLRTELAIEAWHWSAFGRWSDPRRQEGYWTGDPDHDDPSPVSHGYRLPRRGDTLDEADNNGFSRLVDGDAASFWKSNPYLESRYTGVPGDREEWIKIDLGAVTAIDAMEIAWAEPFARRYRVQRWEGDTPYRGRWLDFPGGRVDEGRGGLARLRLGERPANARYVRLRLETSSHTAPAGATDPRDAMGYAIREIRLGRQDDDGRLVDALRHAPDHRAQSLVYVSSTDPWHRAADLDPSTEQPSPLALARAGLIGGGPMMLPVGVLYDTPENALAEVAYFQRRGLKVERLELGEEPDGQRVLPTDYGPLYVEFARALHARWPNLVSGGPSLINGVVDLWLEDGPDQSWTHRFTTYLKAAGAQQELGFFSFEHYPFDDLCGPASAKLMAQPAIMDALFRRLRSDDVPARMPLVISEYGLSAYTGLLEVEPASALFTAQVGAEFLAHGGETAFLYGFAPDRPAPGKTPCAGRGNMMLWEADKDDRARWPMPSYYGYMMLTRDWAQAGRDAHRLFAVAATPDGAVSAYPVLRPDGRRAVMLINRSDRPAGVKLAFEGAHSTTGGVEMTQYDADRYGWSETAQHPVRDLPPRRAALSDWRHAVTLPPLSLTVLRDAEPSSPQSGPR